jgi:hypothetical protein
LRVHELETGTTRTVRELADGWSLPLLSWYERNPARRAPAAGWEWIPVIAVTDGGGLPPAPSLELVEVLTGESWVIHEFGVDLADPEARRQFRRCGVVEMPPTRRWPRPGSSGGIYGEDQLLFGDCTEQAHAEALDAFGQTTSTGLIRLRGLETGDERTWPLPADWEGSIARVFLDRAQQKVLLDIRTTTPTTSYAMVIDQAGATLTFPQGWIPLGWIDHEWFLLKKEESGSAFLARAAASSGEVRGLYPSPGEMIR